MAVVSENKWNSVVCIARQDFFSVYFPCSFLSLFVRYFRVTPSLIIMYEILCMFFKICTATANVPDMKKLIERSYLFFIVGVV